MTIKFLNFLFARKERFFEEIILNNLILHTMKKISFMIVAVGLLATSVLTSCKKESVSTPIIGKTNSSNTQKMGGSTYHSFTCDLPGGGQGCNCVISTADENCEIQRECTANSSLSNFNSVLHAKYTQAQIQAMYNPGTIITDVDLNNALLADGFPIIQ
jgi:hypothetical protein